MSGSPERPETDLEDNLDFGSQHGAADPKAFSHTEPLASAEDSSRPSETMALTSDGAPPSKTDPSAPSRTAVIQRDLGDYELLEEVARGGMGVVYKARQKSLNRVVALKRILEGQLASDLSVQRFQREARAAAALDHPHIVPIFEIGQHDGHHFFTMAYIEGTSLKGMVQKQRPSPERAVEIVQRVADAVEFAHRHGIIHRDLKPDNVLLDSDGRPRVTDFGLAKHHDGEAGLTASGDLLGTPAYMAPEQGTGGTVGPAADVYALGGILYFLLTGRAPFVGASVHEVLHHVFTRPPTPPRNLDESIPEDLEKICLKCLEKEPEKRYPSAGAFAAALTDFSRTEVDPKLARSAVRPVKPAPSPDETVAHKPRRTFSRAAVALVGLVVLAAAGVGAVLTYDKWGSWLGATPAQANADKSDKKDGEKKDTGGAAPEVMMPPMTRHDFQLKVEIADLRPGDDGVVRVIEGLPVAFRITADEDAYIGVWTVRPDGTVERRLFPNKWETNNKIRKGETRIIPDPDEKGYDISPAASDKPETIRVIATSDRRPDIDGELEEGFQFFKSNAARQRLTRGLRTMVLREKDKHVAEAELKYLATKAK
jgi:serine/threonine protein kinase